MIEVHQGDIIVVDAESHAGREMGGHNVVVISDDIFW